MPDASSKAQLFVARQSVGSVLGEGSMQVHGMPSGRGLHQGQRLARFLKGLGQAKWEYRWQPEAEAQNIRVFVDSTWAGCRKTRRSTTGGMLKIGRHPLRTWPTTQPTIATSSGEAVLIAMSGGGGLGLDGDGV